MVPDPAAFRAPYIPLQKIRRIADEFRGRYWCQDLPVDIMDIIDFELGMGIETRKSLQSDVGIDALLMSDFQTILLDYDQYMDKRYENRLRFSVAHEVGHLVLHRDVWESLRISSEEDWIAVIQGMPDDQYAWLEQHAHEFAGRLLVPLDLLQDAYGQALTKLPREVQSWDPTGQVTCEYIANHICSFFGVSAAVIERRIRKEGLLGGGE